MSYYIDLQHATAEKIPVDDETLILWATLPLKEHKQTAELTLRLVDDAEITQLNHQYRQQNKATNVLAFASKLPHNIELDYEFLGDIVICPAVLERESIEQEKSLVAHWAHIVIHGVLHLLGYDHIKDSDAKIMQTLEAKLLATLGFADPYCNDQPRG